MRMDTDRCINKVVLVGDFHLAVQRAGAIPGADSDDGTNFIFTRTSDDLLAIGIETRAFEMGVGVNEHAFTSALPPTALLPENSPAPAFRLRAKRLRSSRSTPVRAAFVEQGWPRSPLFVPLEFPARTPRRCPPESASFRIRG